MRAISRYYFGTVPWLPVKNMMILAHRAAEKANEGSMHWNKSRTFYGFNIGPGVVWQVYNEKHYWWDRTLEANKILAATIQGCLLLYWRQ